MLRLRSNLSQNGLLHNPLVVEVLYVYNAIRDRQLTFLWIASHVRIRVHGNELAESLAKVRSSP